LADMIERNDRGYGGLRGIAPSIIVKEEEKLVSLDRPADAAAKLVADERRTRNAVLVVEEIVGLGEGVAVILAGVAVPFIGAAFCGDDGLRAAAAALFRERVGNGETPGWCRRGLVPPAGMPDQN
jgi:hypothetical protein